MKKKLLIKLSVLDIFLSIIKIALVELSYAINLNSFSYHKSLIFDINPFLSLLIYFSFHLVFYGLMIFVNYFFCLKDKRIIFIIGVILTIFEVFFYNLKREVVDIVSAFDLILLNLIVTYELFLSQAHYFNAYISNDNS